MSALNRSTFKLWSLASLVVLACSGSTEEGPSQNAAGTGGGSTGTEGGSGGGTGHVDPSPIEGVQADDGQYTDGNATEGPLQPWTTTPVDYTVDAPTYELPLAPGDVANLGAGINSSDLYPWSADAQNKLLSRGMVVIPSSIPVEHFDVAYEMLSDRDLPILVTADSTLHLFHLYFDQVLKNVETRVLIPSMRKVLPAVRLELASMYMALDGDLKEAARRTLALVTTAEALLSPDTVVVYDVVQEEVQAELDLIQAAGTMYPDPILDRGCYADVCAGLDISKADYESGSACYCHDYTQYKPRGHYTQSEDLEAYFRAMMLLGRLGLRVKSPVETRMAALLTAAVNEAQTEEGEGVLSLWSTAMKITSFFAGSPDDLTFVDYDKVLREVYGDAFAIAELSNDAKLSTLRDRLRQERKPAIASDFVHAWLDETQATMGLRFFGQRYSFDSYVLAQLTFARVGPNPEHPEFTDPFLGSSECGGGEFSASSVCEPGNEQSWAPICCTNPNVCRVLPSGLDVASALGSSRAEEHLDIEVEHCRFKDNLASLRDEVAQMTDEDHWKSLHSGWLHMLSPLFDKDYSAFPTWMAGETYADKRLNTGLASWAQLRHDTILYTKQSYTSGYGGSGGAIEPPPKENAYYVEPVPEVYSRLSDLVRLMKTGLESEGIVQPTLLESLSRSATIFDTLTEISIHELGGNALTDPQVHFIDGFGESLTSLMATVGNLDEASTGSQEVDGKDALKTSVIADVHTDPNSGSVWEAGSGRVDWMVVVNELPDGTRVATVGPVLSFYEFAWPMNDRLTDEQWRAQLGSATPPARPEWLEGMYAKP